MTFIENFVIIYKVRKRVIKKDFKKSLTKEKKCDIILVSEKGSEFIYVRCFKRIK